MAHAPEFDDEEEETSTTTWHNPTDQDVRVRLYKAHHHKPGKSHVIWSIKAGETKSLSSDHDNEIRLMREGVVVGGKAPQLIKAEERHDPPEVHESLDVPEATDQPKPRGKAKTKADKDKSDDEGSPKA